MFIVRGSSGHYEQVSSQQPSACVQPIQPRQTDALHIPACFGYVWIQRRWVRMGEEEKSACMCVMSRVQTVHVGTVIFFLAMTLS